MSLFPQAIPYRRDTGGYDSRGIWETTSSATGTVQGSMQPASGDDLEALPENERKTGLYKVYIDFSEQLIAPPEGSNQKGDILTWLGGLYQVTKEAEFNNGLLPHRKYFAQYIGEAT